MTTFDFGDGNGPVPAHKHPNGGGWVADTATVKDTAYVGLNARVSDNAQVYGDARVCDTARVSGDALIYGNARVYGDAWVFDNAEVGDDVKEDMFIEMNGKRYKLVEVE